MNAMMKLFGSRTSKSTRSRLQTEEDISPHGGTTLFVMEGVANALEPLPKAFDPEVVRDELEELGDS